MCKRFGWSGSKRKIVKTKIRNRMGTQRLQSILAIRAALRRHGKCCHDFELPQDVLKKLDHGNLQNIKCNSLNFVLKKKM